jgi:glycosyltransferase involved in cell wall biosynthesis
MEKKITVVIPTWRRPQLLSKCIESLLNQSVEKSDFELVIVSDGPDETTKAILAPMQKKHPGGILHIHLPYKKGPAAARNLGWLQAKGKLIAFTDDDCIADKNWLKDIWEAWNGEELAAFSGRVIVPLPDKPTDYELNTANLEKAEFITANCACTKSALLKTGGFDERFTAAWREDSDLHFKLLIHRIPVYKINAAIVHPVRTAPWGISLKEEKKGMFNALLYKKYPALYKTRINAKAPWHYYACIASFLGGIAGLAVHSSAITIVSWSTWSILVGAFAIKRLTLTSRSISHVLEIIVTSIAIPFVSVYWQLYGAWKYRVLFI